MMCSPVLAIVAVSSAALAGNPPAGHWRMTQTTDKRYGGDLYLAPVGNLWCAYYRYDNGVDLPDGMTLEVDRDTISGTYSQDEDGKIRWKLVGKKLVGRYTDAHGENPLPWVASFVGSPAIKLEATYNLDWDGGEFNATVHFTQSGNIVIGAMEGRKFHDPDGTIIGVMYGDFLAGVYVARIHPLKPANGIVMLQFAKHDSGKYNVFDGVYSVDMRSCTNGGRLGGAQAP